MFNQKIIVSFLIIITAIAFNVSIAGETEELKLIQILKDDVNSIRIRMTPILIITRKANKNSMKSALL